MSSYSEYLKKYPQCREIRVYRLGPNGQKIYQKFPQSQTKTPPSTTTATQKKITNTPILKQKAKALINVLEHIFLRRRCTMMKLFRQKITLPSDHDQQAQLFRSMTQFSGLLQPDEALHCIIKIYQTKQHQQLIWAFLNLKFWHVYKKLTKLTHHVDKITEKTRKIHKKNSFDILYRHMIEKKQQKKQQQEVRVIQRKVEMIYPRVEYDIQRRQQSNIRIINANIAKSREIEFPKKQSTVISTIKIQPPRQQVRNSFKQIKIYESLIHNNNNQSNLHRENAIIKNTIEQPLQKKQRIRSHQGKLQRSSSKRRCSKHNKLADYYDQKHTLASNKKKQYFENSYHESQHSHSHNHCHQSCHHHCCHNCHGHGVAYHYHYYGYPAQKLPKVNQQHQYYGNLQASKQSSIIRENNLESNKYTRVNDSGYDLQERIHYAKQLQSKRTNPYIYTSRQQHQKHFHGDKQRRSRSNVQTISQVKVLGYNRY